MFSYGTIREVREPFCWERISRPRLPLAVLTPYWEAKKASALAVRRGDAFNQCLTQLPNNYNSLLSVRVI